MLAVTVLALSENEALLAPDGTVTEAGTGRAALELESVTTTPDGPAAVEPLSAHPGALQQSRARQRADSGDETCSSLIRFRRRWRKL